MPMASMPQAQQLTHINTDGVLVKIWGITNKEEMRLTRDIIDVYSKRLQEGLGLLRSRSELIPGKIVLAMYNNQYHRAEVMQSSGTRKVVVNLIDLGVCTSVDFSEIRLADGIFATISRDGLAEEFILQGAIVTKRWTAEELISVNSCLAHCTQAVFTGIVCDKKLISVAINVNRTLLSFSTFLRNSGLVELVSDEQLTTLIQTKYGREVPTNQYHVPPPTIPPSLPIPHQTQVRPNLPAAFSNDVTAVPPAAAPNVAPYHRIRTPRPPPTQSTTQVQAYTYPTLPVGSTHEVYVSHVIDGMNAFTIQLKDVVESALPRLMAKINDIRPIPFTDPIGPGTICLGRYTQDNSLCRAVVSNVLTEGANLYFVDFGNSEVVPFNEIYRMPAEFLQEPTMAVRFGLADVSSNYSLTTNEASAIFSELVLREDTVSTLKVTKSEVPSKQSCELFLNCNGKLVNVKTKVLDKVKLMKPVEYPRTEFKKNQVADVVISFAESPMRFYAQLEVNQSLLEYLMKSVEDYCLTSENKDLIYQEDVNENMAVCAQYEDGKWYRGIIVDEPDSEGNVSVVYVDFGNQDTVHFSQLRMMNNEMISRFPMQAIECRLDVDVSFTCTAEVSDMFVNLVDGQCFKMTIKNVLPGKVLLVDLTDAEGISVADRLKETFTVKPTSPPVTPNAYAAPPKAQLQKSQSGNWREKNAPVVSNHDGDFSSFRTREDGGNQRPPRDPNYRSEHDDRCGGGRPRNYDSRRRDSDGVDTTDDAWNRKSGDFWGREKGGGLRAGERQNSESGEPWRGDRHSKDDESGRRPPRTNRYDQEDGGQRNDRHQRRDQDEGGQRNDRYQKHDQDDGGQRNDRYQRRDQDDGGRKPYRRRDDDSGGAKESGGWTSERHNSQESSWGSKPSGGDKRFDRGNRGRTSDDESHGGRPPRRDNDFGTGWKGKREDGGFENRGPRRDNRSNDDNWHNKREEKTNDTWGAPPESQSKDDWSGGQTKNDWSGGQAKEDCRGNRRNDSGYGNRREGGFKKRDDNFSQNSYDRGPRKWEDRSAPVLEDGYEKGAQLIEPDYQPEQEMDAVITWFVNPVRFYVMPADNMDFRSLMEQVQDEYPKKKPLDTNDVSPNDYVMARDKDKVIYRAQVLRTGPRGVIVTFVDYGNTELVSKNQVWAIGADHCAIPKQAICCSLYNIAPVDENGVWKESPEYDTYFSKDNFKLTLVQCVEEENGKTWLVNLTDPDGQDIADQLVANNLAVKKLVLSSEEPYDVQLLLHQTISVFLGAADSAKRFFVHIEPHKADHIRTCIETLAENPQALVPLPAENIVAGEFCLATSTDGAYYRALILSKNEAEKQAHVLFIDYGDECDVAYEVIMSLPDYLQIYNAQAIECCLYDSESFTNDDDFIKAIEEKDFIIKVMDVKDNKLHVKVFDVNGASLPYPAESDETVPAICPLSIVRPVETVMISSMTEDTVYLQRVSDQTALTDLNAKLFEKYETEGEQEKAVVEPGKFYAAKSAQFEAWYRCQLAGPDSDKVIYIDYGNTETIETLLAVKPLDEEFFSVPACSVGVRTSARVKNESVETLLVAVQDNIFKGTFKNTGPSEWFVDLQTNDGKNFADVVVETDCGTKLETESEKIYDAFENWRLHEEKKVKVSAVYSPTRFYVQLAEDAVQLSSRRDQLEEALKLVPPMVGKSDDLCGAKSADDGKWYRCYQSDNIAVDYGFTVNVTTYKKLPFGFTQDRSKYVAECRLNVDAPGPRWPDEAVARFKELVKDENEIVCKLEFYRNPKIVELVSNGNSVTETLVTEGVAKYQSYDVVISHVVSLSEFYIQEKEMEDELFAVLERLTEAENWEPVAKPERGDVVAAKFVDDEQWYRAEVKSVSDEEGVTVQFIDYGNVSVCQEFRSLPDDLKSKPKFASHCVVHPLPENANELTDKFAAFVDKHADKPFSVYFLSRVEPMLVMLYFEDTIIEELLQDKPAPTIQFENVSVVHINSPSSFYVQTETPLLDTVAAALETVENAEPVTSVEANNVYAAKFADDGLWYRAKAIGDRQVLFIDYGNTSHSDEFRYLPECLENVPYLAKHCAIPTPCGLEEWPEVATVRFAELTCDGNTVFKMSVIEEGDPAFVELRDDGVNVMEELNTLCEAEKTAPTKDDKPTVILSYITSVNEIWIQEQKPAFDELTDELANVDGFDTLETADKDTVVAALFDEDGVWYRAKVLDKLEDGFQVLFVDFGNESPVTQIKSLPEDLAGMPAFAVCCRLAGLPDDQGEWCERVLAKLKEINEAMTVFRLVEKIEDDGVLRVTLHYEDGKNLVDELLKTDDQSNDDSAEVNHEKPVSENVEDTQTEKSESVELVTGVISEAKSVTEFYIQNYPDSVKETQNSIQTSESAENAEPVVGSVVSALDETNNTWYRSKIEKLDDNKESCCVTRIDFGGNFVTKKWTCLPEEVANAPAKAFKCCLTLPDELTSKQADVTEKFLELVNGEESTTFTYKIDGSENEVTNVQLFKDGVNVLDLLYPDRAKSSENVGISNDDVESESLETQVPDCIEHTATTKTILETEARIESENGGRDFVIENPDENVTEDITPKEESTESEEIEEIKEPKEAEFDGNEVEEIEFMVDSLKTPEVAEFDENIENQINGMQPATKLEDDVTAVDSNVAYETYTEGIENAQSNVVDEIEDTETGFLNVTEKIEFDIEEVDHEVECDVETESIKVSIIDEVEQEPDATEKVEVESNDRIIDSTARDSDEIVEKSTVENLAVEVVISKVEAPAETITDLSAQEGEKSFESDAEVFEAGFPEADEKVLVITPDETAEVEKSREIDAEHVEAGLLEGGKTFETVNKSDAEKSSQIIIEKRTPNVENLTETSDANNAELTESALPESDKSSVSAEDMTEEITKVNDELEAVDVVSIEDTDVWNLSKTPPNYHSVTPVSEASFVDDSHENESDTVPREISSESQPQEIVDRIVLVQNHRSETDFADAATNDVTETFNVSPCEKHSNASDTSKTCSSLNVSRAESVYLSLDEESETDKKKGSSDVSSDSCGTFVAEISSNVENSANLFENDDKSTLTRKSKSAQKSESEKSNTFKDHWFTVSYVDNPGSFFVQKTVDTKRLNALEKQLQSIGESSSELKDVEIGSLVGAKIENCWVRAKVIDMDDFSGYMVFCIDYGTETKSKKLFELPPKLKLQPPMVKRCGIPLPAHLDSWPADVSVEFEEITQIGNPTFKITPIDENDDISYINLTRDGVDVWQRINELCQNYDDDGDNAQSEW